MVWLALAQLATHQGQHSRARDMYRVAVAAAQEEVRVATAAEFLRASGSSFSSSSGGSGGSSSVIREGVKASRKESLYQHSVEEEEVVVMRPGWSKRLMQSLYSWAQAEWDLK